MDTPPAIYEFIEDAAERYQVDGCLVLAIIDVESEFQADKDGDCDGYTCWSHGLMQVHRRGAGKGYSANWLKDPKNNIDIGTRYLSEMLALFDNSLYLAISAYNQGPGNALRYGWTVNKSYVHKVLQARERWQDTKSSADFFEYTEKHMKLGWE
jgi:soluble lytic murein transglycosylase-like protein